MKKMLLIAGFAGLLATAHSASFAAAHHSMKAKVLVVASHAKTASLHSHANKACPTTDKCKCD